MDTVQGYRLCKCLDGDTIPEADWRQVMDYTLGTTVAVSLFVWQICSSHFMNGVGVVAGWGSGLYHSFF